MAAIDLTGINSLKFDIRSSRTGANIKLGIHDTGGTTTELTPTINSADTYETKTWDISGVADADKNAIDSLIVTVVNADAANTFYLDNFFSYVDASFTASAFDLTLSVKGVTYRSSVVVDAAQALALTLWNPNIRIDSTFTDTAQTLTLDLKAPVIRGDANVSVLVQALTLALKDPTYRSDVNWTATVQALVATLKDPTISWSSTVSPTVLTLTATLKDGTPFLVTRILRKGYTFGVVEQVTYTKLNNIADSAIWEISNQVAGDMFYYQGDEPNKWKRIPKGTTGQVLTVNASGVPRWA